MDVFLKTLLTNMLIVLTWVTGLSKMRESSAIVENTQVLPVPDFACTMRSERYRKSTSKEAIKAASPISMDKITLRTVVFKLCTEEA